MSLDAIIGKPSPIPPVATHVPAMEHAPEPGDLIEETMSIRDLQRAMSIIKRKRLLLDIVGAEVGSDRVVTAKSLLTGV